MSLDDEERLSFTGRRVPAWMRRDIVVVPPDAPRTNEQCGWSAALVLVEHGDIELETATGARLRLATGAVLTVAGLSLVAIHCVSAEPAVLSVLYKGRPCG